MGKIKQIFERLFKNKKNDNTISKNSSQKPFVGKPKSQATKLEKD